MSETTKVSLQYGVVAMFHAPTRTWQFSAGDQNIGIDRDELVRLVAGDALAAAERELAGVRKVEADLKTNDLGRVCYIDSLSQFLLFQEHPSDGLALQVAFAPTIAELGSALHDDAAAASREEG